MMSTIDRLVLYYMETCLSQTPLRLKKIPQYTGVWIKQGQCIVAKIYIEELNMAKNKITLRFTQNITRFC